MKQIWSTEAKQKLGGSLFRGDVMLFIPKLRRTDPSGVSGPEKPRDGSLRPPLVIVNTEHVAAISWRALHRRCCSSLLAGISSVSAASTGSSPRGHFPAGIHSQNYLERFWKLCACEEMLDQQRRKSKGLTFSWPTNTSWTSILQCQQLREWVLNLFVL